MTVTKIPARCGKATCLRTGEVIKVRYRFFGMPSAQSLQVSQLSVAVQSAFPFSVTRGTNKPVRNFAKASHHCPSVGDQ